MSAPHIAQAAMATAEPNDLERVPTAAAMLDAVEACFHARHSEWIFLRELRVGTGFQRSAAQRLDAFALNCLPHTSMKRVCYEVKTSRADFLSEMKQPLKRRIGLRYSNEFYFVTPPALLKNSELPIECGLVEVGAFPKSAPLVALSASGPLPLPGSRETAKEPSASAVTAPWASRCIGIPSASSRAASAGRVRSMAVDMK